MGNLCLGVLEQQKMKRKRDNDETNETTTNETRKGKEKVRVEEDDENPLEEGLEDIPVYEGETHPETGLPHGRYEN